MLELFTKKPVFQGGDEIHQLEVVFKIMGTPTPERWADVINLPWFELVKPQHLVILPVDHLVIANTLITSFVDLQG